MARSHCHYCRRYLGEDTVIVSRSGTEAQLEELRSEVEARQDERDTLLRDLSATYEALRYNLDVIRDIRPDTVLGGNGADACWKIAAACDSIGARLSCYSDTKEATERWQTRQEIRAHWTGHAMKALRERDEARAKVERLTAENKRLTTLAANNSAWRAARDQARDDAKRLRAAVKEARWQLERAEPQSDMSRVECTSWHDRNLRWLAEHGKEAGDE